MDNKAMPTLAQSFVDSQPIMEAVSGLSASVLKNLKPFEVDDFVGMPNSELDFRAIESVPFKTDWHQLLVIGNGFDLECDLRSRYSDFFGPRREAIAEVLNTHGECDPKIGACLRGRGMCIWDLLLCDSDLGYWYDVEGAIADWVEDPLRSKSVQLLRCLRKATHGKPGGLDLEVLYPGEDPKWLVAPARFILETEDQAKVSSWGSGDLLGYLFAQLGVLESAFSDYLSGEVERADDYKGKAMALLGELLFDECASSDEHDLEASVLSFNYTRPAEGLHSSDFAISYTNVHGRLGREIVFGIDGTDHMDVGFPEILQFTKTYRLMDLEGVELGRLAHGCVGPAGGATDVIKFYGHSLSKADYSYFQALFDTVGLYDGRTRLIFYYRAPKNETGVRGDERKARDAVMKSVTNLLSEYGKTMDNKDHGKNLIHKLLLERRLSVRLLEDRGFRKGDK